MGLSAVLEKRYRAKRSRVLDDPLCVSVGCVASTAAAAAHAASALASALAAAPASSWVASAGEPLCWRLVHYAAAACPASSDLTFRNRVLSRLTRLQSQDLNHGAFVRRKVEIRDHSSLDDRVLLGAFFSSCTGRQERSRGARR